MRLAILYVVLFVCLHANVDSTNILPPLKKKSFMHIEILDQKRLSFKKLSNVKFSEISDLTYHKKDETLYLVSDKGAIFAFNAHFSDKIDMLIPLRATTLKSKEGKELKKWKKDSEGLTLDGKGKLLLSFEGEAEIAWFHKNSAKYGNRIRKYTLPKTFKNTKNYRSKNKSLESLAWHPKYGILTATEWPLKKYHKKKQTIYSLSGKKWHFKAEPEGRSGLVAMEVMDDGNILVMERSYTGLMNPLVITLKKVFLNKRKKGMCETKVIAKMNNHKGWDIDNFEGLARVGSNRYVMVSDDSGNFFQRTLLIYFEVIDE